MDAHMVGKSPRELYLDDFGLALLQGEFGVSFPSDEIQANWTGVSGWETMRQAIQFLRVCELGFVRMVRRPLDDATILDFGCGWGRMLRLLPHYTSHIYGCDPWDVPLQICDEHNVPGVRVLSDPLADTLPFPNEVRFDLAFAYSVFTHTDLEATLHGLKALRSGMALGGVGVITIRPVEYWSVSDPLRSEQEAQALINVHHGQGFAHFPHGRANYGDTSMTMNWLKDNASGWYLDHYARDFSDPRQIVIFLRAV